FFFRAEDGIRDFHVTGVQTCALPICCVPDAAWRELSAIVTPENVAFMKQTKQRSYEERDLADEEVRRTNEWMDGVNAAVAAYNEIGRASWRARVQCTCAVAATRDKSV